MDDRQNGKEGPIIVNVSRVLDVQYTWIKDRTSIRVVFLGFDVSLDSAGVLLRSLR